MPQPRALVLSPSASHPQDFGNRNRVWQVTNFLKTSGYAVDFLLYPVESDWSERVPEEADELRRVWDGFWIVPPSIPLHRLAHGDYHAIDEWWDEAIGHFLIWLFARRSYDVFVVNYTFLSKAFTFAPNSTVRVLETHDLFAGRKEMLAALGAQPEFFYTTEEQERLAFERADIVIAIKDSEAALIRKNTSKQVVSVPFFPSDPRIIERDPGASAGLAVGFIGALNSINVLNMQSFLAIYDRKVRLYWPAMQLFVAGDVCKKLSSASSAVVLLGRVPSIGRFYSKVDVIVAPMMYSTGIKIKVGEALAAGKGVVSTANGFDGYPAMHPMHALSSREEVGQALIELAYDEERLANLIECSRISARLAQQATKLAFDGLSGIIRDGVRRILLIVDEPYWAESTFRGTRLAQWANLCKLLAPVITLYLRHGNRGPVEENLHRTLMISDIDASDIRDAADVEGLAEKVRGESKIAGRMEVMLSVDADWAAELCRALVAQGHCPVVDLWCPGLAAAAAKAGVGGEPDLRIIEGDTSRGVETTALRWTPDSLRSWSDRASASRAVLVRFSGEGEAEIVEDEIRAVLRARGFDLEVVSGADALEVMERLYDYAKAAARPAVMLSIGDSLKLVRGCMCIASIGKIPYFDVDAGRFPVAFAGEPGRPDIRMFHTRYELVEAIAAWIVEHKEIVWTSHASDAGWSRIWARLENGATVAAPGNSFLSEAASMSDNGN
jgi:glycosyltransferase involved in cell wall biosynthesis